MREDSIDRRCPYIMPVMLMVAVYIFDRVVETIRKDGQQLLWAASFESQHYNDALSTEGRTLAILQTVATTSLLSELQSLTRCS